MEQINVEAEYNSAGKLTTITVHKPQNFSEKILVPQNLAKFFEKKSTITLEQVPLERVQVLQLH